MTTARDVIANVLDEWRPSFDSDELLADKLMAALLSAPDSIRQELAALLNPWREIETAPKDGTPILLFWPGQEHVMAVGYKRTWMEETEDRPTKWLPLPLPAPPSEDK